MNLNKEALFQTIFLSSLLIAGVIIFTNVAESKKEKPEIYKLSCYKSKMCDESYLDCEFSEDIGKKRKLICVRI